MIVADWRVMVLSDLEKKISSSEQSSRNQDDDYDIRLSKLSLISLIQHSTPYTRPDLTFSLLL